MIIGGSGDQGGSGGQDGSSYQNHHLIKWNKKYIENRNYDHMPERKDGNRYREAKNGGKERGRRLYSFSPWKSKRKKYHVKLRESRKGYREATREGKN